jgi:pimeloyl-ACP methyl ester carboxylesterase
VRQSALPQAANSEWAPSRGGKLHLLRWASSQKRSSYILFLHGFKAHAHWWDHIAPAFLDSFDAVALDFGGMGDSSHYGRYDHESYVSEVYAAISHLGAPPYATIGHSFGGGIAMLAGAKRNSPLKKIIALDTYLHFEGEAALYRLPDRRRDEVLWPTFEALRSRYRLVPDQPNPPRKILDHVARHSIAETSLGWRWKFDRLIDGSDLLPCADAFLPQIDGSVEFIVGENSSIVDANRAKQMVRLAPSGRGPTVIPGAHHHLVLDKPGLLVDSLRNILIQPVT